MPVPAQPVSTIKATRAAPQSFNICMGPWVRASERLFDIVVAELGAASIKLHFKKPARATRSNVPAPSDWWTAVTPGVNCRPRKAPSVQSSGQA